MEERMKHDNKSMAKKKRRSEVAGGDGNDGAELNVAGILLQLHHMIADSESQRRRQHRFRFPFDWSVKRKRSALNSPPSTPPSPLPPSSEQQRAATGNIACKSDGTSPTTPFSLVSPSRSDDTQQQHQQLKLSSSKSIDKKREELLEMVNELTQCRILLKQEVETERYRHKKLKAINTELKLKKNELICGVKIEPNIETNGIVNLIIPKFKPTDTANQNQNHTQYNQHHQQQQLQPQHHQQQLQPHHQQQQQQHQKHYSLYNNNDRDFTMPNTRRVSTTARTGGILDLNVMVNDAMPSIEFLRFQHHFDFRANLINKAMVAAEARKRRRQIYKAKNRTTHK